jgi:hypothetical protein
MMHIYADTPIGGASRGLFPVTLVRKEYGRRTICQQFDWASEYTDRGNEPTESGIRSLMAHYDFLRC